MEIDHIHGEINRHSNGKLSIRDRVQSQPLFPEDNRQSPIQKGLAGINKRSLGVTLAKLGFKLAALSPQAKLIKDIQRRAKLSG